MSTGVSMDKRAAAEQPERMAQRPAVQPAVDVFENKDELQLVADIPGVATEGVSVHFDKGKLTFEARVENDGFGSKPFDYRRSFLAQGVDAENITAEVHGGVLKIHLPKAAALKPRQIQVKAG